MPGENAKVFAAHMEAVADALKPRDVIEGWLCDRAGYAMWAADRASRPQVAAIAAEVEQAKEPPRWMGLFANAFCSRVLFKRH